jgi:hypothetical protein
MPVPIVKVDSEKLLKKMREYERVIGKNISQQIRNYSRLAALDLMRQTIPYGQSAKEKRSGEKAINTSLLRAFRVLAASEFRIAKSVKKHGSNYAKVEHWPDRKLFWVDVNNAFLETESAIKAHHQALRRKGRVPKNSQYAIVPEPVFKRYQKAVHALVGYAKAGWAAAAQKVRADTEAAETGKGIPAWIKRHIGKHNPTVTDRTNDKKNPRVTWDSSVSFMDQVLPASSAYASLHIVRGKMLNFLNKTIRAELRKVSGK